MRCFVAIELPAPIRASLADLQARLGLERVIRWTRTEQIHLTLKFLGEVPDGQVPEICSTALAITAEIPPIRLEVCGAGCFPPRGPARVVWAGIAGPPPELVACHRACEQAFAELGFPPEDREFRPHLTIGRSRDQRGTRDARSAVEGLSSFAAGSFTATEMIVFQSVLSRSGATYTPLARAEFGR
jgi:2'-5' RNA ligase